MTDPGIQLDAVQRWQVVVVRRLTSIPNPATKFVICLGTDATNGIKGVIISSRPSQAAQANPRMQALYHTITCGNYPWLNHDSVVDCGTLISVSLQDCAQMRLKGHILQPDAARIKQIASTSGFLNQNERDFVQNIPIP